MDWTFGTEELASYAALMQEAEAAPVLLIHPDDAGKLGLDDGSRANLHLPKGSLAVTVKLAAAHGAGGAGAPPAPPTGLAQARRDAGLFGPQPHRTGARMTP